MADLWLQQGWLPKSRTLRPRGPGSDIKVMTIVVGRIPWRVMNRRIGLEMGSVAAHATSHLPSPRLCFYQGHIWSLIGVPSRLRRCWCRCAPFSRTVQTFCPRNRIPKQPLSMLLFANVVSGIPSWGTLCCTARSYRHAGLPVLISSNGFPATNTGWRFDELSKSSFLDWPQRLG